jgi:hypothetical protein
MMRTIHTHEVTAADKKLGIRVADEPGAGGANHHYLLDLPYNNTTEVFFQNGPIENGEPNGITQEVLLAVVIDRLQCFQRGQFACRENAIALTHIETGLLWLQQRTRDRIARQVEGTNNR